MKIIGGQARGRVIQISRSLLGHDLRPTTHKVREALFDILQLRIIGSHFLDLFAGTGAIGIEAVSRGAHKVILVESNNRLINNIKRNIEHFDMQDKIVLYKDDALRFLRGTDEEFDIIFADPPYGFEGYSEMVSIISEKEVLKQRGMLIIEHSSRVNLPELSKLIRHKKSYRYGDTTLKLYIKEDNISC